jgi:hypothetical protein
MIKILSLCAALLAPESSGLDPHGRSLHLKLHEDFNTSYSACIATAKQARKYGIDPFVSVALLYKETKFSPKLAKRSKIFRDIREIFGCERGATRFIKSSCSAFMIFAPHLATMLEKNYIDRRYGANYRKALRDFFGNRSKKRTKVIENMAKRYADVYSRTHTGFIWNSPFRNPESIYPKERHIAQRPRRRQGINPQDQLLNDLMTDLGRPRAYDYRNRQMQQKMEYDLQLLYRILGNDYRIEAKSRNFKDPEYFLYIHRHDLREILYMSASLTSSQHKPHTFQEHSDGKMSLLLNAPKRAIVFAPYSENIYVITIK